MPEDPSIRKQTATSDSTHICLQSLDVVVDNVIHLRYPSLHHSRRQVIGRPRKNLYPDFSCDTRKFESVRLISGEHFDCTLKKGYFTIVLY
ncbi:hypothetical protein J6590_066820 [Homalodisca vitripennis]|nr:hypothetical protein J6590_066820 [Homalodisca vitripennis]